jgi:hypothetical protein
MYICIPIPHSSAVPWNGNETGSSSVCPWNETLTDCGNRTVANDHEIHSEIVCDLFPLNPLTSDGGATDCGSDSSTTVFCSWTLSVSGTFCVVVEMNSLSAVS